MVLRKVYSVHKSRHFIDLATSLTHFGDFLRFRGLYFLLRVVSLAYNTTVLRETPNIILFSSSVEALMDGTASARLVSQTNEEST